MNLQISLGNAVIGEDFKIDFLKDDLQFSLIQGDVGSGKSTMTKYMYTQLIKQNTPEELGFVFLDFTQVDYIDWESNYSFLKPTGSMVKALEYLELIVDLSNKRSQGLVDSSKAIFVHFQQNDLFVNHPEETHKLLSSVKPNSNTYFIYLTANDSELSIPDWYISRKNLSILCTSSNKTVNVGNNLTNLEPLTPDLIKHSQEFIA